jgi:hypothetical protein
MLDRLGGFVSASEASATAKAELQTFGHGNHLEPGAYFLDLAGLATFPLKDNGQPSTFADIYRKLRDTKILKVPNRYAYPVTFETNAGDVTVDGDKLLKDVLRDLIDLEKDGIDAQRALWFYYGYDWSREANSVHEFFVVHDGKIVREGFPCFDDYPQVLTKSKVDDNPLWHSEPYGQEAWETYWYRKFYAETITGQQMVLRPDKPTLYRYDRTAQHARDLEFLTLIKIYRLLWVAVSLLAAIAFPKLWPFMAVVATIAMADLLWICWQNRNLGR